ncbi:FAD-dependent oxidoreductase [Dehalobacter sp. DCM]|uniref:FAD-dependent oxidoreductase n=1 Tax=Dehalobacter sp. DCM TaxID=2907827 RepID=UPI00308131B6|nr:FAD-dependent oxidoreductase [Dehalobacter sp. DCM]
MENKFETDVVVIGSGATGLAAALTAAEGGARVMIFEKQRSPGGTSNFFGGSFAVESELQRKKGITYSKDEAFRNIMQFNHWRGNPRLVRAIVEESSKTIVWLQQQGIEFTDVDYTYHVIKGHGAALVKKLVTNAKEKGVELRLGASVSEILKDGNAVSGVVVEQDGEEFEVAAKAVVVASGGYANNKEWIKKYCGYDLGKNITVIGNVDKMGDGIRMAWEAGAAKESLGLLELNSSGSDGPDFTTIGSLAIAGAQPDLWVDPRGQRFCDETVVFWDSNVGNANARIAEGFSYRLFDDSIKESLQTRGIDKGVGFDYPPGTRLLEIDKELAVFLENGSEDVFMADSIEELAVKINVDPAVLTATVAEYNSFCAKKHDDLFVKEPKYLRPLLGPKYYAVISRTVFLGTLGGIKINHNMEAVDKYEKPVPGLYAGGYDADCMHGDTYSINVGPGLCSAFALNSGRIAGQSALKYLGK